MGTPPHLFLVCRFPISRHIVEFLHVSHILVFPYHIGVPGHSTFSQAFGLSQAHLLQPFGSSTALLSQPFGLSQAHISMPFSTFPAMSQRALQLDTTLSNVGSLSQLLSSSGPGLYPNGLQSIPPAMLAFTHPSIAAVNAAIRKHVLHQNVVHPLPETAMRARLSFRRVERRGHNRDAENIRWRFLSTLDESKAVTMDELPLDAVKSFMWNLNNDYKLVRVYHPEEVDAAIMGPIPSSDIRVCSPALMPKFDLSPIGDTAILYEARLECSGYPVP